MASLPIPHPTPADRPTSTPQHPDRAAGTRTPSPRALAEHRLQEPTIVPVPRPPVVRSADW